MGSGKVHFKKIWIHHQEGILRTQRPQSSNLELVNSFLLPFSCLGLDVSRLHLTQVWLISTSLGVHCQGTSKSNSVSSLYTYDVHLSSISTCLNPCSYTSNPCSLPSNICPPGLLMDYPSKKASAFSQHSAQVVPPWMRQRKTWFRVQAFRVCSCLSEGAAAHVFY